MNTLYVLYFMQLNNNPTKLLIRFRFRYFRGLHDKMLTDRLVLGCKIGSTGKIVWIERVWFEAALEALRISKWTQEQLKHLDTGEQDTPIHALRMDFHSQKHQPNITQGKYRNTPNTTSSIPCSTRLCNWEWSGCPGLPTIKEMMFAWQTEWQSLWNCVTIS